MVLITLRSRIQSLYGSFTEELDSKILVGQLRIFWHSVAGAKEEKKRRKKKAPNWTGCKYNSIYSAWSLCVFKYLIFQNWRKKEDKDRQHPERKGKPCMSQHPECIHTMNIPPEHTPADSLADKSLPGNNHRSPSDSVFQHSGWEGFETYKFQFPGRRAEDMTLQVGQCEDSIQVQWFQTGIAAGRGRDEKPVVVPPGEMWEEEERIPSNPQTWSCLTGIHRKGLQGKREEMKGKWMYK